MNCVCEKDTEQKFYPLNRKKTVTYTKWYNYHYKSGEIEGTGGYTMDSKKVTKTIDLYLRVNYPYAWETDASCAYHKRIFHCPLCGRLFPPQTPYEKMIFNRKE